MTRRDLSNRSIGITVVAGGLAAAIYFAAQPSLPEVWRTPGTPPLYLAGVAGSLLLLVPAAFAFAKRSGLADHPTAWFVAHVLAGVGGAVLIAIHNAGTLERPPALMLIGIVFLVVQGAWARTMLSRTVSATFGRQLAGFSPPDSALKERLSRLIGDKEAVLIRLDVGATEGTFSLTPRHWLASFQALGLSPLPEFYSEREQLLDLPYLELLDDDSAVGIISPFFAAPTATARPRALLNPRLIVLARSFVRPAMTPS